MKVEELKNKMLSCGVVEELVDIMFSSDDDIRVDGKGEIFVSSPFVYLHEKRVETTPSFHINLNDELWYDHSTAEIPNRKKRGGHLNTLIVMLGGAIANYEDPPDIMERYAELILAKGRNIPQIASALQLLKPSWNVLTVLSNPCIGYDEGRNALLFFTFKPSYSNPQFLTFSLTPHAHVYPLGIGTTRKKIWIDFESPNREHDSFQNKVVFVTHPALRYEFESKRFIIFRADYKQIMFTEGEPDTITMSFAHPDAICFSWKNYAVQLLERGKKVSVFADSGKGAIRMAKEFAIARTLHYKKVFFYEFTPESFAAGDIHLPFGITDNSSENFDSTVVEEASRPSDANTSSDSRFGSVIIPPHRKLPIGSNFDVTDLNELHAGLLYHFVEYCGIQVIGDHARLDDTLFFPVGYYEAEASARGAISLAITRAANANDRTPENTKGHVEYRSYDGSSFLSSATILEGYIVGQGQSSIVQSALFRCSGLNEGECGRCPAYLTRELIAKSDADFQSLWLMDGAALPLTVSVLPGSKFEKVISNPDGRQRLNALKQYGQTCNEIPDLEIRTIQTYILRPYMRADERPITFACIDESVLDILNEVDFMQRVRISGYYSPEQIFMAMSITPISTDSAMIEKSAFIHIVEKIRDNGDGVGMAKTSAQIWELFKDVIKVIEIAVGEPGYHDPSHVANILVSLMSSTFMSTHIRQGSSIPASLYDVNDHRDAYYCGYSLFLLGEVSTGKTAIIRKLGSIFGNTISLLDAGSVLKTVFVPSAVQATSSRNQSGFTPFTLGDSSGGLLCLDGLQTQDSKKQQSFTLSYEHIDSVTESGMTAAHGILSQQAFGNGKIKAATPIIIQGNFRGDNIANGSDFAVMTEYRRYTNRIGANESAMRKRFAPIRALRQSKRETIREIDPKKQQMKILDAIFLLTSIKAFQLSTMGIHGNGQVLMDNAERFAVKQGIRNEMLVAVGRRAISIANAFRVLRVEKEIRSEDIEFVISLIANKDKYFHYCDMEASFSNADTQLPAQSIYMNYAPWGSPLHRLCIENGEGWTNYHISSFIGKSKTKGEYTLNISEVRQVMDTYGQGTDMFKFLNLKPDEASHLSRVLLGESKSGGRYSQNTALVSQSFIEGLSLLSTEGNASE